jgi:predicted dienelactone hydrolase
MHVRRPLCFLIALAWAVLAAACGGGSDAASEPTAQPEATATSAAVATAEPTEQPAAATPTVVSTPTPTPGPSPTPDPATALPDITDVGLGPYPVGVQTITVIDSERDRTFPVEVWFPLAPGTTGELARYTFVTGDYFESARAITAEPELASTDGPFPLVVYSHGSGGIRYIHSDYTETIASHGYVVIAPDHPGNTSIERVLGAADEPAQIAVNRPGDVIAAIDAFLDADHPRTGPFTPLIDAERIAVTGHSFGGFTTYAVASGYENELGSTPVDDRVGALIPIAPAVGDRGPDSLLSADRLRAIEVPTLIIAGTDDRTTPVEPNVNRAWEYSNASPHFRLELVAAEHQTFTDLCDYVKVLPDREGANPLVVDTIVEMSAEGCGPDDMPIERAKALVNTFAVTFLDSVFRDGEMFSPGQPLPNDIVFDEGPYDPTPEAD